TVGNGVLFGFSFFARITTLSSRLFATGTDPRGDDETNRRITLTNQIATSLAIIAFPNIFIFYFINTFHLGSTAILTTGGFITAILANYYKKHLLAKLLIIFDFNLTLFIYAPQVGKDAGLQIVLMCGILMPILLFSNRQLLIKAACVSTTIICLFVLEFTNYSLLPRHPVNPLYIQGLYYVAIFSWALISTLCLRFYYVAFKKAEMSLKKSLEEAKERKLMLEKANQQAAFATLTRGIAHEIRNPMGMILSGMELILDNLNDEKTVKEYAEMVKKAILRLSNVTNTMLKYGSPVSAHREPLNCNELVEDVLLVAKGECRSRRIKATSELEDIPLIDADAGSVSQALLNIVLNGIQAIEDDQGQIIVSTSGATFKDKDNVIRNGVRISIRDTGKGISQDQADKIFDPFFTTKHKNTGLGLSLVLKTINEHRGNIEVNSAVNEFTTVSIYLPAKT
ncbi:MAG: signal transduction histidine kinase, partial [Candidatus Marinamargulisbacteria bacterium]